MYQYRDLEHADSIRLLELEPAKEHDDDLHGSLIHTTVWECSSNLLRPYTALSYVWGSPQRSHKIYIVGDVLEITSSLNAALRDMRDSTLPHRIWADALCINQADNAEKSAQVAMMGRIYSTAAHTVIHLPLSTPGLDRAADAVLHSGGKITATTGPEDATSKVHDKQELESCRNEILAAPWFKRAWVFQELVLSLDPWVQINRTSRARWTDFCSTFGIERVMSAMRVPKTTQTVPESHPNPFIRMSETRTERFAVPLHTLLTARRGIGATDSRDVVYANMGIISDLEEVGKHLAVDYSKTTEAVFLDTARYVLAAAGIDTLLSHAPGVGNDREQDQDYPPRGNMECLPSWMPIWSREPEPGTGLIGPHMTTRGLTYLENNSTGRNFGLDYEAGLRVKGVHSFILSNPSTLCFTGLEFDIVEAVTTEVPRSALPSHWPPIVPSHSDTRLQAHQMVQAWPMLGSTPEDSLPDRGDEARIRKFITPPLQWIEAICEHSVKARDEGPGAEDNAIEVSSNYHEHFKRILDQFWTPFRAGAKKRPTGNGILFHNNVTLESHDPGNVTTGRRFAVGKSRSLHLVPMGTREGDIIVDVGSSFKSLVLRPMSSGSGISKDRRIIKAFNEANRTRACRVMPQVYVFEDLNTVRGELYVDPKVVRMHLTTTPLGDFMTPRVRHCLLVGEASSIRMMSSETIGVGSFHDMDIFTLH